MTPSEIYGASVPYDGGEYNAYDFRPKGLFDNLSVSSKSFVASERRKTNEHELSERNVGKLNEGNKVL